MAKTIFKTTNRENLRTKLTRFMFNFFPAYRRTGGHIAFISHDWKEVHIKLGYNWKTRNLVGSVFGGSIYGALDPIFMTQLIKILGKDFVVWDKTAIIKFKKPIRKTVYARFFITDETLKKIVSSVRSDCRFSMDLSVNFTDESGTVYAEVIKGLYIADREYYKKHHGS